MTERSNQSRLHVDKFNGDWGWNPPSPPRRIRMVRVPAWEHDSCGHRCLPAAEISCCNGCRLLRHLCSYSLFDVDSSPQVLAPTLFVPFAIAMQVDRNGF